MTVEGIQAGLRIIMRCPCSGKLIQALKIGYRKFSPRK